MPQYTDDAGRLHSPHSGPRILSVVPSLTETIFDLGLATKLVGRTSFCIHPKNMVDTIPSVGGTKRINMEKVKKLCPTHALVNIDENPKQMADDLLALGIDVVVTHPNDPVDNLKLLKLLGGVFNVKAAAHQLADDFDKTYSHILNNQSAYKPERILYLIWQDPWMTINTETYISRTLQLVNWQNNVDNADHRYPEINITDDYLSSIDLVLFSTEPYAFTLEHIKKFGNTFPEHAHKAHIINGEYTSWYGSRATQGLSYLADFARKLG